MLKPVVAEVPALVVYSGYMGDLGDRNTVCFSAATSQVTVQCASNKMCVGTNLRPNFQNLLAYFLHNRVLLAALITVLYIFQDIATGRVLSTCNVADTRCKAVCACMDQSINA